MELVGNCTSVVESAEGVTMEFRCTNQEVFTDILVPPALKLLPEGLLRIYLHRKMDPDTEIPTKQWVLNHFEELI